MTKRFRAGWVRVDGGRGKLPSRWVHVSGAVVEHCGHPTALRPWTGWTIRGRRAIAYLPDGGGWAVFGTLDDAMRATEQTVRDEEAKRDMDGIVIASLDLDVFDAVFSNAGGIPRHTPAPR